MTNNNSAHILTTSSNLLGFCLVVLTSLKITKFNEETLIDEATGIACILLIICGFLAFLSLRASNENFSRICHNIADIIFIVALLCVFTITFMIAFSILF